MAQKLVIILIFFNQVFTVYGQQDSLFTKGIEILNQNRYDTVGLNYLKRAADANNVDAQNLLGHIYIEQHYDYGLDVNYSEGTKLILKAARKNHPQSQATLGYLYHNGVWFMKNDSIAFHWYNKSAIQNNVHAQGELGLMYLNGEGTRINLQKAIFWLSKAAKAGYARAQINIGLIYLNGSGIKKNEKMAIMWFRKAARQGHGKAIRLLKQLGQSW